MKKIPIVCVGIGGYANVYLESLLDCKEPAFYIAGAVDIAPQGCRFFEQLKSAGVPFFTRLEDFYASHSAELAIITTPIHLHTRQIICALENGSNVLCEKPLSGVSADAEKILSVSRRTGRFVMIGYQWSYSDAINALKRDILDGVYGRPEFLKSMVLWPRPEEYFTRSSGWGGRLRSPQGDIINDSVVNNATAHYLHNMLYVTGCGYGKSAEVTAVSCDLLRCNRIENFDTAVMRMTLDNGAKALFVASHDVREIREPCFEYRFSGGVVTYDDRQNQIIGKTSCGRTVCYGNPSENVNKKIYDAISAASGGDYEPPCGVAAAAPQVRCVELLQTHPIFDFNPEYVRRNGKFLYIDGLDGLLIRCYQEEKLLSELSEYEAMVKRE